MTHFQPKRGFSREEAAHYIGIGTTKFDQMVADGRMPQARIIDTRRVWCVRDIDVAFDKLPLNGSADLQRVTENPWGRMAA